MSRESSHEGQPLHSESRSLELLPVTAASLEKIEYLVESLASVNEVIDCQKVNQVNLHAGFVTFVSQNVLGPSRYTKTKHKVTFNCEDRESMHSFELTPEGQVKRLSVFMLSDHMTPEDEQIIRDYNNESIDDHKSGKSTLTEPQLTILNCALREISCMTDPENTAIPDLVGAVDTRLQPDASNYRVGEFVTLVETMNRQSRLEVRRVLNEQYRFPGEDDIDDIVALSLVDEFTSPSSPPLRSINISCGPDIDETTKRGLEPKTIWDFAMYRGQAKYRELFMYNADHMRHTGHEGSDVTERTAKGIISLLESLT